MICIFIHAVEGYYVNMYHFVWADQRPVQKNISYIALQPGQYLAIDIAWEGGSFDPHFNV